MKLRDFAVLTDENIDPDVVAYLRQAGFDVFDVCEQGLQGSSDVDLLRRATHDNRLVMTHDADFGTLAILNGEPLVGLVFLRPGHFDPQFTIGTVTAILAMDPELTPPLVLVAKRTRNSVSIRIRALAP